MSSSSFQDESSPSSGRNSFDLNINSEEATVNISQRPMGMKKAKRKQQSDDQFKQMMEQNDRLIKAIAKGTSERNEIQKQKVEVQRMKQENKILFADLNSITDPASREYIENQRAIILRRRAPTNQYEEQGEGSQSQYHGSQYRASRYQGEQAQGEQVGVEHVQGQQSQGQQSQGENQRSPSDQHDYTQYYHYFSGTGNNYPGY
uniref:No apical meristem-associated C-terminal domain-containing protein n=1 Tax=Arabis nemorensis TaxID=586526 RepID=A0A565C1L7_9BRAS